MPASSSLARPTFSVSYAREISRRRFEGELRNLPGLEYFNETVIRPGRHTSPVPHGPGLFHPVPGATSVR